MRKKRRVFKKEFKLKVILEALKERSTVKELCQKYELHPNQISKWKQDFLDKAGDTMDSGSSSSKYQDYEKEQDRLYAKIGQLQMEVDFLKKKLS
jgi:Transposase and inactivated derivatives